MAQCELLHMREFVFAMLGQLFSFYESFYEIHILWCAGNPSVKMKWGASTQAT